MWRTVVGRRVDQVSARLLLEHAQEYQRYLSGSFYAPVNTMRAHEEHGKSLVSFDLRRLVHCV
jgi:hypothetical protein